jgi:predicted dithiol-disulfide oxidoreductase (DUF899 family)
MNLPPVVSRTEWLEARKDLLTREKALTRARDELAAARRELPMVRVDEEYVFEGPDGTATLLDLFDGRRQLIVDHMMWAYDLDDDGEEVPRDTGCPSCSARADSIGNLVHLHQRDTSFVAVSRAPYAKIGPFKARMGWTFPWYSSAGSDFNYDFHATADERVRPVMVNYRTPVEWSPARRGDYPGMSAFLRVDDEVFHTYSTFARGLEQIGGTHYYLELTALGRQEAWEKPEGRATTFAAQAGSPDLRFHDEY